MNSPSDAVIEVENLSRSFRLKNVTLRVPEGCVFGLVGENGAGKTTLIKHLLGALKPQRGRVRVFGKDPVGDPVGVLVDVGHLSEDREMPTWMRVHELLRYVRAFYPNWDAEYAEELRDMFRLDPVAKVKHLSRGERALAGLLVALAHRPKLLVLDEPVVGSGPARAAGHPGRHRTYGCGRGPHCVFLVALAGRSGTCCRSHRNGGRGRSRPLRHVGDGQGYASSTCGALRDGTGPGARG